jgi:phage tail-like protein
MKREAIARLLPAVFQRTLEPETPLFAILGVMEQLHAPSEDILRNLSAVLNPRSAPDRFLPYLSRWVNLDWLFETMLEHWTRDPSRPVPFPPGLGSMRELVALAFRLNRESGTAKGLLLFLRTATGEAEFVIEEDPLGQDGLPMPFHIRVHALQSTALYRIILQRIIEFEKPAYVTYELVFDAASQAGT